MPQYSQSATPVVEFLPYEWELGRERKPQTSQLLLLDTEFLQHSAGKIKNSGDLTLPKGSHISRLEAEEKGCFSYVLNYTSPSIRPGWGGSDILGSNTTDSCCF